MEVQKRENYPFYDVDPESGKIIMKHFGIIVCLCRAGFSRAKISENNYVLVRNIDNKIRLASEADLIDHLKGQIIDDPNPKVMEAFTRGVGQYISSKKIHLIPSLDIGSDMDDEFSSKFFFANKIVAVTKEKLQDVAYNNYPGYIWEDRLLTHNIGEKPDKSGQFESFCKKISGEDDKKFRRFKSILGYLLHRHKNPALAKAVIFYDEKMNDSGQAEGGTGKTLITLALKHCRNVVVFNGKEIKENSWFRNQRIELTTDLMAYDDVKKEFNFATLFPVITTSIEVEKKRQQAFEIPFEKSPKVLISSNHYVKGPGGSSDRRRRCEFELTNHYSEKFSPEDDFGNLFFNQWNQLEWDKFYFFMMQCVQVFLTEGLIKGNTEKEKNRRLENLTAPEFIQVIQGLSPLGEWVDQRDLIGLLKTEIPDLNAHTFTKWMSIYCDENGLNQEKKSSGGVYYYRLVKRE
jgi:hypothetical protein